MHATVFEFLGVITRNNYRNNYLITRNNYNYRNNYKLLKVNHNSSDFDSRIHSRNLIRQSEYFDTRGQTGSRSEYSDATRTNSNDNERTHTTYSGLVFRFLLFQA